MTMTTMTSTAQQVGQQPANLVTVHSATKATGQQPTTKKIRFGDIGTGDISFTGITFDKDQHKCPVNDVSIEKVKLERNIGLNNLREKIRETAQIAFEQNTPVAMFGTSKIRLVAEAAKTRPLNQDETAEMAIITMMKQIEEEFPNFSFGILTQEEEGYLTQLCLDTIIDYFDPFNPQLKAVYRNNSAAWDAGKGSTQCKPLLNLQGLEEKCGNWADVRLNEGNSLMHVAQMFTENLTLLAKQGTAVERIKNLILPGLFAVGLQLDDAMGKTLKINNKDREQNTKWETCQIPRGLPLVIEALTNKIRKLDENVDRLSFEALKNPRIEAALRENNEEKKGDMTMCTKLKFQALGKNLAQHKDLTDQDKVVITEMNAAYAAQGKAVPSALALAALKTCESKFNITKVLCAKENITLYDDAGTQFGTLKLNITGGAASLFFNPSLDRALYNKLFGRAQAYLATATTKASETKE